MRYSVVLPFSKHVPVAAARGAAWNVLCCGRDIGGIEYYHFAATWRALRRLALPAAAG